jgi:NAD(P)-dependent dehydrogenase (short-subunit alcohol dehydrogenase family)
LDNPAETRGSGTALGRQPFNPQVFSVDSGRESFMRGRFKPLEGQVIVVTGAGSGLGLEVARLAAKAGASVVLAGGDEQSLRQSCEGITKAGGRCHPLVGDPSTAEGCDRVARTAMARFGRIDSWIEAKGDEAALAHAAKALAAHLGDQAGGDEASGALVGFGQRFGKAARKELKAAKGAVAATLIKLPAGWRHDSSGEAAAKAALYALTKPMGEMAVAAKGKSLTAVTQARKHPGVLVGVGLLALAGAAVWFGRGRIGKAAAAVRPRLARAVRPSLLSVVKRRPVQAAKLVVKHPRASLKLAKALR